MDTQEERDLAGLVVVMGRLMGMAGNEAVLREGSNSLAHDRNVSEPLANSSSPKHDWKGILWVPKPGDP